MAKNLEIERKWMVNGWPEADLPLRKTEFMRQGYVTTDPTVRIREEAQTDGRTAYILCFKSHGKLSRTEIEMEIPKDKFDALEELISYPLIPKERRTYDLPDGYALEVNHVDEGLPSEFWYAEVEYPTEEAAYIWDPADSGLTDYLTDDVTNEPGQSMAAYWNETRVPKDTVQ